jgi:outer membrane protein assembly complex protein YaeT
MMAPVGRRSTGLIALAIAGCAFLRDLAYGAPRDYEGKPVQEIRFNPPLQPLPDEELRQIVALQPGQPLRLDAVRESIVRLYATGRYRDIAADVEPDGGGVKLEFQTRTTWFVGRVSVEGVPEPPNRGQLINATRLELGREFSEEQAEAAIANILEVLRNNGFYEAHVDRFLDYQPAFAQVNILFHVNPGPRARFSRPVIRGVKAERIDKLIAATRWRRSWFLPGWKTVTERRLQQGLERIRSRYQKQNRLLNRVALEKVDYEPEDKRIIPTLAITEGPEVQIRTSGARISGGTLRRLVPVFQEHSVDRDLLVEGARNLTEHFQNRGYFDAAVSFRQNNPSPDLQVIEFQVDPGRRYRLVRLEIRGNRYFDGETIRERMGIAPASLLRYRHGRYSQAMLEDDINALTSLYRSNGFREVQITARIENPYRGKSGDVAVFVDIEEGRQWLVSELELEGVSQEHRNQIYGLLSSLPGQPYSEVNVAIDRDNVLDYYYNRGYLNASLEWSREEDPAAGRARIHMKVEEGPQRFVRATLIGGLEATDPDLVTSRFALRPGDPLSQSRMVQTQRRLYDLGIFARVDAAIQNPEGDERSKYILHQFEEARRHSVNFGLGAQIMRIGGGRPNFDNPAGATGFSPRVSFGVSRLNMFGVGHTAGLQAQASQTRRRALANYLAPQFEGHETLSLTFTGLYDYSRDINTFLSTRAEGSVQTSLRLSRASTARYGYTFRQTNLRDVKISEELIPIFVQAARVGFVSGGFIQDKRDDPLESTRGAYSAVEAALASRIFGSQTEYLRLTGRNATYHRLGRELVLARAVTVGWLLNTAADPAQKPVPLPERFFSGGAASLRAFPDNQAGPRDPNTGFVIGGQALLMHNLELRFPLLGDNIGGVLFHDAGNVYSTMGKLSLRFHQKDERDFDYMVHAFGLGIRYRTPVGPVRLDLAYSPNAPRFFGFRGTPEQLLAGGGERTHQRISPFQFFFSIGQTF